MNAFLTVSMVLAGSLALAEAALYAQPGGHVYNSYDWAGVSSPFASSTCFGCRGKRSAQLLPFLPHHVAPGVAFHPTGTSFEARSPQGVRGKRSAEPAVLLAPYHAAYPHHHLPGVAFHPTGTSFEARSPQGLRGKRSADPALLHPIAPGVAHHPTGTSFEARSPQGLKAYPLFPYGYLTNSPLF